MSLHEDVLDAVITRLGTLDLDGLEDRIKKKLAWDARWASNLPDMPCLVVSGWGIEQPIDAMATNRTDSTGLPVTVRILVRDIVNNDALATSLYDWRETIRRGLRTRRPGELLPMVRQMFLLPSPTYEPEADDQYAMTSSPLFFSCHVCEPWG